MSSIANNNNYRVTSNKECIYAWYPPGRSDSRCDDPKEIYAKLGSRPPRNQSYCEAEILYNYHQSMKQSEFIYKPKQTPEEALKPPWSLNLKTTGEYSENAEKTIPEAFSSRRAQSAPAIRNAPTHRIILKIPTPQFHNLFDGEAEEYFENNENKAEILHFQSDADGSIKTPIQIGDLIPPEQYKSLSLNEVSEVIITNSSSNIENELQRQNTPDNNKNDDIAKRVSVATNHGKKPLVFDENVKQPDSKTRLTQRPKTASANFRRSQSSASLRTNVKARPKSSLAKSKTTFNQSNNLNTTNTMTDNLINSPIQKLEQNQVEVKFDDTTQNTDKTNNLQSIIASHPINEQQYHFNHFYNSKSSQNLNRQSTDPTVIYVDPGWVDNYLHKNKLRNDIKIIDGNWKDQIINRNKYLQKRPNYFVKVDLDKLKPDPPAPELHYKASETFFYNTLPHRKMTFNVDPNFISENLNVRKLELQNRPPSSTGSTAIRYRRDYAFAY